MRGTRARPGSPEMDQLWSSPPPPSPDTAESPADRQADDQPGPSTRATPTLTASARKLSFNTAHGATRDSDSSDRSSDTSPANDDVEMVIDATGRRPWDCAQLTKFIQRNTVCRVCHGKNLVLKESAGKRKGWCSEMTLSCDDCARYSHWTPTSTKSERCCAVNRAAVLDSSDEVAKPP